MTLLQSWATSLRLFTPAPLCHLLTETFRRFTLIYLKTWPLMLLAAILLLPAIATVLPENIASIIAPLCLGKWQFAIDAARHTILPQHPIFIPSILILPGLTSLTVTIAAKNASKKNETTRSVLRTLRSRWSLLLPGSFLVIALLWADGPKDLSQPRDKMITYFALALAVEGLLLKMLAELDRKQYRKSCTFFESEFGINERCPCKVCRLPVRISSRNVPFFALLGGLIFLIMLPIEFTSLSCVQVIPLRVFISLPLIAALLATIYDALRQQQPDLFP